MSPLTKTLIASALTMAAASSAAGQNIPEPLKPIAAATRIFALENHLHSDIEIAGEDEGHIGNSIEVNHAPGEKCTFTMRRRNGPVVETISFDKLSGEFKAWPQHGYARMSIPGKPGAQCEVGKDGNKCSSSLDMVLMVEGEPSELDLARRALGYIASVCPPAEMPF